MNWRLAGRTARAGLVAGLVSALLASPGALANACTKPIRLATGQWEPYSYYDAQRRFVGIDVDMVHAIFKEAGCTLVELGAMPASRNLTLFFRGDIDLMTGASRTPERLKRAWFSLPYRDETVGLFALADGSRRYEKVRSFDDFLGRRLTLLAPRTGWYGDVYEKQMPALLASKRLSQFSDFPQGIRMLAAGRAQFMLGDASGVEHAAARQGIKVEPLPFWLLESQVHLMFNRSTIPQADVRRIDAAIERLQRRGVFERIRRSYGGM